MEKLLSIGSVISDLKNRKRYRVVAIEDCNITLCEMDIDQFVLCQIDKKILFSLLSSDELAITKEEAVIFDQEQLKEEYKNKFKEKKNMMMEVLRTYGPSYMELAGRKQKPELKEIMVKYNCPRNSFWRICTSYFQSGLRDYSLVDSRYFRKGKAAEYNYEHKTGRPSEYFEDAGLVINDEIRSYFDEALKKYKSGRHKTVKSAFDEMNLIHFTKTEIVNGEPTIALMPISQRPTMRQFRYYFNKHITNQEKDLIKTSALEQRNNKRLITSDSLCGINGPGDMVEIDACEADVSLVSAIDPSKTVGRPIVYFMVDVYSRIILAMSVAFDNNSILGLTNLFLNLADNKQEYCAKYGIHYDNPKLWPSNIIPNNVRVDRGSEFRGKQFERICDELGIQRHLVAPGSGSLKGVVEQSFHQMHTKQNVHLEKHGLIEKRYDSIHHQTATLNIEEYTRMVINFVLTHNQQCLMQYPLTKEMIQQKIKPIPALLWEYGVKEFGTPRPIPEKEQYFYNLMIPVKAKLTNRGIGYKDLWYLPKDDQALFKQMFDIQKKHIPFDVRMDMRDVGHVYYLRNGKLIMAPLNDRLNGNAEYAGLTMKEYEDFLKSKRQLLAEGKTHNEELSAFSHALNHSLVEEAKKPMLPDHKNMRTTREIEKQTKSKSNRISKRLEEEKLIEAAEIVIDTEVKEISSVPVEANDDVIDTYDSWEDALDDW